MNAQRVKLLASQMLYGAENENKVVSASWYRRFIQRAREMYPELIVAT
jgi:RecA-family ATPase